MASHSSTSTTNTTTYMYITVSSVATSFTVDTIGERCTTLTTHCSRRLQEDRRIERQTHYYAVARPAVVALSPRGDAFGDGGAKAGRVNACCLLHDKRGFGRRQTSLAGRTRRCLWILRRDYIAATIVVDHRKQQTSSTHRIPQVQPLALRSGKP